jgi:CheY-like chemotaxis protein
VLVRLFCFRVETFASAREFLDSGRLGNMACLILNLRMPGMDGLELQCLPADANHRIPINFVHGMLVTLSKERQRRRVRWLSCASLSVDKLLKAQCRRSCSETIRTRICFYIRKQVPPRRNNRSHAWLFVETHVRPSAGRARAVHRFPGKS